MKIYMTKAITLGICIIVICLLFVGVVINFVVKLFGDSIEEKDKDRKKQLMKDAGWVMDDYCVYHRGNESVSYSIIMNLSAADIKKMYCK